MLTPPVVDKVPECFGVDIGGFKVKEEWSGKTGVDPRRQERCGKCPLVLACAAISICELVKERH